MSRTWRKFTREFKVGALTTLQMTELADVSRATYYRLDPCDRSKICGGRRRGQPIRSLPDEFVYLAVVLDAYSRLVIGWALERSLEAKLAIGALRMAVERRGASPGLIHHSDRGVQYACGEYTEMLTSNGIQVSMSRKGNPYDNAKAESFMKTLKHEEVYRVEYRDLAEARSGIRTFLERTYNRKRLHSALGYLPPAEFDRLSREKIPA